MSVSRIGPVLVCVLWSFTLVQAQYTRAPEAAFQLTIDKIMREGSFAD